MITSHMEPLTGLPAPEGYPAIFAARSTIEQELSGLLDVLHLMREHMTSGVMPSAARFTGTGEDLRLMVEQLDTAIGIGRKVLLEVRPERGIGIDVEAGAEPGR